MQARTLVVGSGVAGLGVAWALRDDPDVLVVDGRDRVGGNVRTVDVDGVAVDMGFIVCNPGTYPRMMALLGDLDVATAPSDMSLSVRPGAGREWAGSAAGLLGDGRWRNPRSWRRLGGILALSRRARRLVGRELTVGEAREALGEVVVDDYLVPMVSAIWSSPDVHVDDMPLDTLVAFFDQHHLFDLASRPEWRTIPGGAATYVAALRDRVAATFATDTPIAALQPAGNGWRARTSDGRVIHCERVVLATPADVALALLGDHATPIQHDVLGAFRSTLNRAWLHADDAFMPRDRSLWSSWNVRAGSHVAVTYWMNRLQPLPAERDLFVTLNPRTRPDDVFEVATFVHPVLDRDAQRAQQHLCALQGDHGVWVCGAWTGYGFHEDGLESGLAVGADLQGLAPPRATTNRPAARVVRQ